MNSTSGNSTEGGPYQSWTASPSTRGTIDILKTCLLTIFLCCWTSVCPNIPGPNDGKWTRLRDKASMACLGLLGPEFLLTIASGQITSATESVRKFRDLGKTDWTRKHAFYAGMGGFVLQAEDEPRPFPLDAAQLHYLVERDYVDYPHLTEDDIEDKNKADVLARAITLGQATWFLASTITRGAQGLAITTLELTTISFTIVAFAMMYFWFDKPLDVSRTNTLNAKDNDRHIRAPGPPAARRPWHPTPLDFVSREETGMSLVWAYYNEILRRLRLPLFSRPVRDRPHDRIPSDQFPKMSFFFTVVSGVFILAFGATFAIAWNWHFPTEAEQVLWRTASIYNAVYTTVGGLHMWLWDSIFLPRFHARMMDVEMESDEAEAPKRDKFGDLVRNLSPEQDPWLRMPLRYLVSTTVLCASYCVFRLYIFIEDFIGLRSLPASAFQQVDWSRYIPHF